MAGGDKPIPQELPLLALPETIVFPHQSATIDIAGVANVSLVDAALASERLIALFSLVGEAVRATNLDDFHRRGTAIRIEKMRRSGDDDMRIVVRGVARIEPLSLLRTDPFPIVAVRRAPHRDGHDLRVEALRRHCRTLLKGMGASINAVEGESASLPGDVFANVVAGRVPLDGDEKREILDEDDVESRFEKLIIALERESKIAELETRIKEEVEGELGKRDRERFLRQKLESIRRELGEDDERTVQIRELNRRLIERALPAEADSVARDAINRLGKTPVQSGEFVTSRTHVDWILGLPWKDRSEESIRLESARVTLEENHFGLDKAKERVLEFLAVRQLKSDSPSPLLCFIGPPGTGKSSMGHAIADSLGRRVAHVALGGVTDDGEIRGHRMTYTGALPGRILQELRRVAVRNPVFMLDEIDKVGSEFRGDPSASLLEVLDPNQNRRFFDHYLGLPFDLSDVFFIATANTIDSIPPGLLDRMELVHFPGYTTGEKIEIVKRHLLPNQLALHGIPAKSLHIHAAALRRILDEYANEAGLRDLERCIATICRKRAVAYLDGERKRVSIRAGDLPMYLGIPRYFPEVMKREPEVGVVTTLAWTPTGGEILFIEATRMPGGRSLQLTGQLGGIMRESAEAALSVVRAMIDEAGGPPELIDESDIHIHVPAGSMPKDGPSAGVALVTALYSLFTARPVRCDIAMTGEITLRGRILPVSGIKEKVLGAHRAGIREVVLPERNELELREVPEDILSTMKFYPVGRVEEVFSIACPEAEKKKKKTKK